MLYRDIVMFWCVCVCVLCQYVIFQNTYFLCFHVTNLPFFQSVSGLYRGFSVMQECVKICALCDELKLRNSISNCFFLADTVDKNQNYQVCNIIVLYILAAIYGFVQVWALPILGRPNFAMCVQTCIYVHSNTHTAKK